MLKPSAFGGEPIPGTLHWYLLQPAAVRAAQGVLGQLHWLQIEPRELVHILFVKWYGKGKLNETGSAGYVARSLRNEGFNLARRKAKEPKQGLEVPDVPDDSASEQNRVIRRALREECLRLFQKRMEALSPKQQEMVTYARSVIEATTTAVEWEISQRYADRHGSPESEPKSRQRLAQRHLIEGMKILRQIGEELSQILDVDALFDDD